MRRIGPALLMLGFAAAPAIAATPPVDRDGVIRPMPHSTAAHGGVDPHMPVLHPKTPGRAEVIRPPRRTQGGHVVIDPR